MKNCPMKELCYERFSNGTCDNCIIDKTINKKDKEIARLTAENERLTAENVELRARLENHDLPVNVWDTVYCIRDCGTVGYRIDELKVIEIVFEYNNQMRIKTCYGLFGCEKWTFGLDCFADRAKAEARLKELLGGE